MSETFTTSITINDYLFEGLVKEALGISGYFFDVAFADNEDVSEIGTYICVNVADDAQMQRNSSEVKMWKEGSQENFSLNIVARLLRDAGLDIPQKFFYLISA